MSRMLAQHQIHADERQRQFRKEFEDRHGSEAISRSNYFPFLHDAPTRRYLIFDWNYLIFELLEDFTYQVRPPLVELISALYHEYGNY